MRFDQLLLDGLDIFERSGADDAMVELGVDVAEKFAAGGVQSFYAQNAFLHLA